ncbi:diguanylate cyclase [Vibrio sp. SS-MA-C1-2]|uniref:GGDEF domain-containing response regulator n=1 Tax=Vibrio sp. SS-MA-C1-2 TaxID=2908646 RepID=UPI001F3D1ED0|nr:diguanylate cyclase [Vibrio sp. SS-MA-C1-2]UJF17379.1 diguanylate cyclase [Vibrio sp. SS-MA-C1-2]
MRILLVDDIKLERESLRLRLSKMGHKVLPCASGKEAIEQFSEFVPDVVLLDIAMPEMDGYQVAKILRQNNSGWTPIIFLSGYDSSDVIAKAIDSGGDDYLVKPVDRLVLISKMKAMQRIAHMRNELQIAKNQLEHANDQLRLLASVDSLTGIANRRHLDQYLLEKIQEHGREGKCLSVIMIDIDHFKAYNDTYGHIQGDYTLRLVAQTLKSQFNRSGELVARYGGEEFFVVLSHCNKEKATQEAARLQTSIHKLNEPHESSTTADHITLSLGVLSWPTTGLENVDEIYKLVDQPLYQAKSEGRDRFVVADIE